MRAVFLDKDGTLVEDIPYNVEPARIRLMPGAGEALGSLQAAGFHLFVISNQSGVARGYFDEAALRASLDHLRVMLAKEGVRLNGFYYCPHHPEGNVASYSQKCDCRKPAPGLLLRAGREHDIDLAQSWFVGDILNDVEAGRRAGCRTILVDNGHETEWVRTPLREPDYTVKDLMDAARLILSAPAQGYQKTIPEVGQ